MDDRQKALKELEYLYQGDVHMIKDLDWLYDIFRQALSGPEWRPIAGAPRDVAILGYLPPTETLGGLMLEIDVTKQGTAFSRDTDEELSYRKPTHWMPLPSPPSESGK